MMRTPTGPASKVHQTIFLLVVLLQMFGCASQPAQSPLRDAYSIYPGVTDSTLLQTDDGLTLFGQWWQPESSEPKAVILLLHGTAAHSGVYAFWGEYLVDNGYAMFAYDMRGWGQSQGFGRRGFSADEFSYLGDLKHAIAEVRSKYPESRIYLQGESLGAGIALQAGIQGEDDLAGLILNAPPVYVNLKILPFRIPDSMGNALVWTAGLTGRVAPNFPMLPMNWRAFERWIWRKAIFDESLRTQISEEENMTHSALAASYVTNLQKMSAYIRRNMEKITLPLIVLQGGQDYLVSPNGAERLLTDTGSTDVTFRLYDGMSHCALHDDAKEHVWQDTLDWLEARGVEPPALQNSDDGFEAVAAQ
ncbi:alpha/beta fold hydrolase [Alcanivorax sediminis]|uniref:Alpha/beta fold hydrolase n=1 Tax=Alcanivorax sediminis TaxID=2663008 RepID=A0A6N7LUG4_9GAMM|nr:alpha/beta fold hydrolase [Alcanivorax sediminis]MQX53993.1 alpha/beta fold hydrolase [Alcanivorax sediminis]